MFLWRCLDSRQRPCLQQIIEPGTNWPVIGEMLPHVEAVQACRQPIGQCSDLQITVKCTPVSVQCQCTVMNRAACLQIIKTAGNSVRKMHLHAGLAEELLFAGTPGSACSPFYVQLVCHHRQQATDCTARSMKSRYLHAALSAISASDCSTQWCISQQALTSVCS